MNNSNNTTGNSIVAVLFAGMLAVMIPASQLDASEKTLFNFDGEKASEGWRAVNDSVMGGVSKGGAKFPGNGSMLFAGVLSLENRGGFSSVRTNSKPMDLSAYDGLAARVRGNGRTYWMTVSTNIRIPAGSFRTVFRTEPGKWMTVRAPFSGFRATSFGRELPSVIKVNPAKVQSIGFLIADKKAGPFSLEVDWIKAETKDNKAAPKPPAAGAKSGPMDIVDTAVAAGSFKTLAAALNAADLVETLKSKGPFTVFAPTDEAFGKLPAGTVESLLKPENKQKLAAILMFHVMPGRLGAADISGKPKGTTIQGTDLLFSKSSDGVKVDRAKVVKADIAATNGVIHVIDRVMMPKDIVDTASAAGQFSTLLAAAKAAGLVEALKATDTEMTVFAPTDEAFSALPAGTVDSLLRPSNRDRLAAILKHHVVPQRIILTGRPLTTLQGSNLQIMSAGPAMVSEARVLIPDIKATNGVIHVIDRVLMPDLPEPTARRKAMGVIELAIRRGVPLFNSHKPEACAAVYEITAQSLLSGHAEAMDESARSRLEKTLAEIKDEDSAISKAWALRRALDYVYRSLRNADRS